MTRTYLGIDLCYIRGQVDYHVHFLYNHPTTINFRYQYQKGILSNAKYLYFDYVF